MSLVEDEDVEMSMLNRNKKNNETIKEISPRSRYLECFTCSAFCMVLLDYLFCWPRHLTKAFAWCGLCPRADCCDGFPLCRDICARFGWRCKCKRCCPPNLRTCNLMASCCHLLLGLFGLIGFLMQSSTEAGKERLFLVQLEWEFPERDFSGPQYQVPQVQNYLNNTCVTPEGTLICPGQNADQTFWDFADCIRPQTNESQISSAFRLATPRKKYEETFNDEFYVIYLPIAFSAITFLFHISLATCLKSSYDYELSMFRQPFRWVEYSITASIMMVNVLLLNNVTDLFILSGIVLLTVSYNSFGGAMEYPSPKDWCPRLWFYTVSTLGFAFSFLVTFLYYYRAISPWMELKDDGYTCAAWGDLFGYVQIIVWGLFGSYLTFPINDTVKHVYLCCTERGCCGMPMNEALLVQTEPDDDLTCCWRCCLDEHKSIRGLELHEARRKDCYRCFESLYIFLSFVSKSFLVINIMIAALMRGNGG